MTVWLEPKTVAGLGEDKPDDFCGRIETPEDKPMSKDECATHGTPFISPGICPFCDAADRASPPVSTDGLVERIVPDAIVAKFDQAERRNNWLEARNALKAALGLLGLAIDDEVAEAAKVEDLTATLADRDATIERMRGLLSEARQFISPCFSRGEQLLAEIAALDASATGMVK